MSKRNSDDAVNREILSALADGQADADEVARACGVWRHQAEARATWHAYHLIGEVMRSPEQAADRDSAAFLQRMRARLAEEPVVLAPQAAESVGRSPVRPPAAGVGPDAAQPLKRRMWAGPMAVAASFAVIVGALTANLGGPLVQTEGAQVARSGWGWAEGSAEASTVGSALSAGGSFSAVREQGHVWQPSDPALEQAMTLQRPQSSPPQTFSSVPGLVRASSESPR